MTQWIYSLTNIASSAGLKVGQVLTALNYIFLGADEVQIEPNTELIFAEDLVRGMEENS